MTIEDRLKAFVHLGEFIKNISEEKFKSLAERARIENPWFTEENLRMSVSGISDYLEEKKLSEWISGYSLRDHKPRVIALIMAGNIPMVGFHDLLCVLLNGDAALIKASSKDSVMIKELTTKLIEIEPRFADKIVYGEMLKNFDAVIATGSDNSSRYFEYYFGKYPHIIRKNRTSAAILTGEESELELSKLGMDIFSYFGLGCRNVSKLFVPEGFDFGPVFRNWEQYKELENHHKYHNNYHYQKSILLVTSTPHLDNGFVLLQESERLVSPIAVLYYEYYSSPADLTEKIDAVEDKLQCVVGKLPPATIGFGEAQCPGLSDYADNVDTMKFLIGLS